MYFLLAGTSAKSIFIDSPLHVLKILMIHSVLFGIQSGSVGMMFDVPSFA
jgi:hypothetical protein